ncbi:hypothetical protein DFH08DRAFT_839592, partial [Mycena albidolilacea]
MVVWVQPTNTTKRIVTTTLLGIAMLTTLFRLRTRIRTRRFWLDDVWAIVALLFSIMLLVAMWLRTIPSSSRETLIICYWILSFGFISTLWASRMSVIFSVVRVIPHDNRSKLRKITNCLAAIFAVFWIGLMIQVANVCGANKSWYKFAKPQCRLGDGVAAFELTSDVFADVTLAILPIVLTRNSLVPAAQRKMLYVIFAASLLTTIASIVHAIFLIGPSGSLEGTAAHARPPPLSLSPTPVFSLHPSIGPSTRTRTLTLCHTPTTTPFTPLAKRDRLTGPRVWMALKRMTRNPLARLRGS